MPDSGNSKLVIINKALAHIKIASITSLTQQCDAARKANLFYDCARKSLLRAADWRFATTKKPLVLLGTVENALLHPTDLSYQDVLPQWAYTYAYPTDCVRFRKVFNTHTYDNITPWNDRTIGDHTGRVALFEVARSPQTNQLCVGTNYADAWAEFTFNITDETQFDDMFQDTLGWTLAAELAIPLSCDKELAQMVAAEALKQEGEAKRKNGGEGVEMLARQSNYESARNGYDLPY